MKGNLYQYLFVNNNKFFVVRTKNTNILTGNKTVSSYILSFIYFIVYETD